MFTKGKWKYEDEYIRADTGEIIADVYLCNGMYWTKTDNANRIVQAVNSHDMLVEALQGILNAGMNGYARWTGANSAERELINAIKGWQGRIKQALANAE